MKQPSKGKYKQPLSKKQRVFTEKWLELGNAKEAAEAAGFSRSYGHELSIHAGVLKYKAELEQKATEKASDELAIDKARVMQRLDQLSQMEPASTNGTITGQVAASKELAKILRMYPEEAGYQEGARQFPDGTMEVYRAKWLKTPMQLPAPERDDARS